MGKWPNSRTRFLLAIHDMDRTAHHGLWTNDRRYNDLRTSCSRHHLQAESTRSESAFEDNWATVNREERRGKQIGTFFFVRHSPDYSEENQTHGIRRRCVIETPTINYTSYSARTNKRSSRLQNDKCKFICFISVHLLYLFILFQLAISTINLKTVQRHILKLLKS